jgi:DNA-binding NtrC family response regulator
MKLNMSTTRSTAPSILVVDGDDFGAGLLAADLREIGCRVEVCGRGQRLERLLERESWDAILADQDTVDLPTFAGVLAGAQPPVLVMMSGFGSIDDAVEAVRAGAADFLAKPVSGEQLRVSLGRALEQRDLRAENRRLREDLGQRYELGRLHSRCPRMREIFDTVRAVADTRATILIEGESGTGKTLLARGIHRHSSRAQAPFIEVNCGALPDNLLESELFGHERGAFTGAVKARAGKFEVADGGTLFLDEIACASLDLQVKLLRVLQDREFERLGSTQTQRVDVRIIAATNQPLLEEVRGGRFREDLFYRLNVLGLEVPPLRERPGDVVLLAERFLAELSRSYGREIAAFAPEAMAALTAHPWPGNVRELENSIERAVLLTRGDTVLLGSLPEALRVEGTLPSTGAGPGPLLAGRTLVLAGRSLREALEFAERELLLQALRENGGSRKATATQLGINRTTLFNKMTKFGLMGQAFEGLSPAEPDSSQR